MSDVVTFQQQCKIRDTYTVHSFVRNSLKDKDVPFDIVNLCIKYYYIERDQFDTDSLGLHHTLNGNTIKHKYIGYGDKWSTSLLRNIIVNGKHEWSFRIYQTYFIQIGIYDAAAELPRDKDFTNEHGYGYQVFHARSYPEAEDYGISCDSGDIIKMCLDMNNLTLSYSVNEKYQGIAFQDIARKGYKAAVYTYADNESIELLDYKLCS